MPACACGCLHVQEEEEAVCDVCGKKSEEEYIPSEQVGFIMNSAFLKVQAKAVIESAVRQKEIELTLEYERLLQEKLSGLLSVRRPLTAQTNFTCSPSLTKTTYIAISSRLVHVSVRAFSNSPLFRLITTFALLSPFPSLFPFAWAFFLVFSSVIAHLTLGFLTSKI